MIAAAPLRVQLQSVPFTELITIPAGQFTMGSTSGPADERPSHSINLPAFSIERTPVTNRQFAEFLKAKGPGPNNEFYDPDDGDAPIHMRNGQWTADPGAEQLPVVEPTWYGAREYCRWAGRRLPTEAEWEKAARGTDGRRFPWGVRSPTRCARTSTPGGASSSRWAAFVWRQLIRCARPVGERVGVDEQRIQALSLQRWRRSRESGCRVERIDARRRTGFGLRPAHDHLSRPGPVSGTRFGTSQHRFPLRTLMAVSLAERTLQRARVRGGQSLRSTTNQRAG